MTYIKGHPQFNTGRTYFKKGFTPWNKGKAGTYTFPSRFVPRVTCICKNCKKEFQIERWKLKDPSRGKFCKRECFFKFNRGTNSVLFKKKRLDITGKNHYLWKGGPTKCIDCGKQLTTYKTKFGRCLFCSNRFRSGENCARWNGGVSKLHKTERQLAMQTLEYKLWRTAVFMRDNFTCQGCGTEGGYLEADHIKSWALYPELRYAIDNGRTLCRECHKLTDSYGAKLRKENFIYAD